MSTAKARAVFLEGAEAALPIHERALWGRRCVADILCETALRLCSEYVEIIWNRSAKTNGTEWTEIGRGRSYVPVTEDIGCSLRVVVSPQNPSSGQKGTPLERIIPMVMERM